MTATLAGDHLPRVYRIYLGSDGDETRQLYAELKFRGPAGEVAINLLRACKASERAKQYRGGNGDGSYRSQAYEKKQWAIDNLCKTLAIEAHLLKITWGWGVDEAQEYHRDVLYVDIPTGQVSFHTRGRGDGPDYPGQWDGCRGQTGGRICTWAARLLAEAVVAA